MPLLTEIVKQKKVHFPLEVGIVHDYDEAESVFVIYLPKRKKTLRLPPPSWMQQKIVIPAGAFSVTVPSQTVTDSSGDTVSIPSQTISFPENDVEIDRYDFSRFIGSFAVVINPVSAPAIVGFVQKKAR